MFKNSFTSIFFAVLLTVPSISGYAFDIAVENADNVTIYYNYINDGKELEVTNSGVSYSYYKYSGNIVVPDEVTYEDVTRKVTSIGYSAFDGCSGLSSIHIPNGVVRIDYNAFKGCSNLSSISIPSNVTNIGFGAFQNCSSLTSITIPNGVKRIGSSTFYGCSGLNSITIPSGVTSIGDQAFYGCSGLSSITIPSGVTSIGDHAFYNCDQLTSVSINSNSIVSKKYTSDKSLSSIFGNQVHEYIIGNQVESIGDYAFSWCWGMTTVTIPNSVTSIGEGAFSGCRGLTSVTIPSSVTSIGIYAFDRCTGLTSITIPNSVTSLGAFFIDRSNLTSLIVESGNPKYDSRDNCNAIVESATNSLIFGCKNTIIPNNITSIGERAFYNCENLTSITIPNSVKNIDEYAFAGSGLTSVTIPNSVTSMSDYAFYNCKSLSTATISNSLSIIGGSVFASCGLTSVTIPGSVTSIGGNAFSSCKSLGSITIPNSVASIGIAAFSGCSGLTSVTISNSVKSIEESTFAGCSSLTSVSIPNSVTSIGYNAFQRCTSLASIIIPNSVTAIGDYAFRQCSSLASIIIPNSVTAIGDYAFQQCTSLASITIPSSVTSVGLSTFVDTPWFLNQPDGLVYAGKIAYKYKGTMPENTFIVLEDGTVAIEAGLFRDCSGLVSVTIPNSVTGIGNSAFNNCSSMTSVIIPNSVTNIGDGAFSYCRGLTSVTIGKSVTSIGQQAFGNCTSLTTITSYMTSPPIIENTTFPSLLKTGGTLYIPAGLRSLYVEKGWSLYFANIVEMEDGEPIWLTIIDAEQGRTKLRCEAGKSYTLQFEPSDRWHIHSVTYCDTDVTDLLTDDNVFTTPAITQNAELYITYSDVATRVKSVTPQSDFRVLVKEQSIVVQGVGVDTLIQVFDLNGRLIGQTKAAATGTTKVAVPAGEKMLIVKVGDKSVKVVNK